MRILLTHGVGIYSRRDKKWWIDICRSGRRLRRSLGTLDQYEAIEMAYEVARTFWSGDKKAIVAGIVKELREQKFFDTDRGVRWKR